MKYEFCAPDKSRYAINLRKDQSGEKLIWNCPNGTDTLVFRTNYGVSPEKYIGEILSELGSVQLSSNEFINILGEHVWCRYVSAADKVRNGGCAIDVKPATYSVFACVIDGDNFKIYANDDKGSMIKSACDITVNFHADTERVTEKKGLFKKETETGYYAINFGSRFSSGYNDGDIVYEVAGIEIPITNEMLDNGIIYVKTEQKPMIKSLNNGIKIV